MRTVSFVLMLCVLSTLSQAVHPLYSRPHAHYTCPVPCRCLKFEGLWSVYCNRTGITTIPRGIPTNTQLLDLSWNSIGAISKTSLSELVNLQSLGMAGTQLNDGSIEKGALDLPNLNSINFAANYFTSVPKALPRNVTSIDLYSNKIAYLAKDSFVNYTLLLYLGMQQTGLKQVEIGTFDLLQDITSIDLSFNQLIDDSLPHNLFSKNLKLTTLGVRFNQLQNVPQNLPSSLLHLDFVGNQIKIIPSYVFKSLPALTTIEFWQGQVTTIEDNAFYGLSKVTILDFMQDHITSTITNLTLNGLTGMKTLYMDLNNVSKIEPGAFRSLQSITELWFSDNQLTTLDPEVLNEKHVPHLSVLYIDGNPWFCDCHIRWLREKVDNASYEIMDPGLIQCAGPKRVSGKAWTKLQPSDFVCP